MRRQGIRAIARVVLFRLAIMDKDDSESRVARLQAIADRIRQEDEAWLRKLGFDWTALPKVDHGQLVHHPLKGPVWYEIDVDTGRRISLKDFHQAYVYAGVLSGTPYSAELPLIAAIKYAKALYPDCPVVVLPPEIHTGTVEHVPYSAVWLPYVRTVARFESNGIDEYEEPYSMLAVIWFQDEYGLPPRDGRVADQLRGIDWDATAKGWMP